MKKTGMKALAGTLAIALTIAVAPAPGARAAKKVSLDKKKLTITVGKSKKLKLKNNKKKVTWKITSGKKCIKLKAKKKTGVTIVAKKKGTAKVQAKIGTKKYTCKVTVKAAQVAATKKPVATVAATVAPTPTPTLAPTPEPTPTLEPTLEPTPTPGQTEDPDDDLNKADVNALRTFIETLKEAGATVSEDIQDAEQYGWDEDGYLEAIDWSGATISGELKFPAFENLWAISVAGTDITSLDVSACSTLEGLDCSACKNLAALNVSGCDCLEELYCLNTALTSLDLSSCPWLYEDSGDVYLPEGIEVIWWTPSQEEILALETLTNSLIENGASNDIAVRDGNGELNYACYTWDSEGRLESIDWASCNIQGEVSLTEFTNLIYVDIYDNAITSLDLSGCNMLAWLDCDENSTLTSLKLTGCSALEYLDCSECALTELDLSDCVLLDVKNTENFLYDNGVQIITPEGDLGGNTFDPEG